MTALLNPEARSTRRPRIDQAESSDYQVTASFVALLEQLGCSLVITNYQSSTVMTFSSLGNGKLVRMFAPFRTAMGLAIDGDRLAVAAQTEIVGLSNIRKLAPSLPKFPNLFDGYFVPRVRYTAGECSLHDMVFAGRDILAVNTANTCICRVDGFARSLAYHGGYPFCRSAATGTRAGRAANARARGHPITDTSSRIHQEIPMSRRQSRRPSFSRDVRAPQKHLSMPHPARILSRGGLLAGTSLLTLALAMPVAQARHRRARPRWPRAMTLSMFHVVGSGELSDDQKKMLVGKETAAAP